MTDIPSMISEASIFNADISNWDVSLVVVTYILFDLDCLLFAAVLSWFILLLLGRTSLGSSW